MLRASLTHHQGVRLSKKSLGHSIICGELGDQCIIYRREYVQNNRSTLYVGVCSQCTE
jgi:hypothetical protein